MVISGRKSIQAIISNKKINHLIKVVYAKETQQDIIDLCKKHRVNYEIKPKEFFDKNYGDKTQFKYKHAIALLHNQKTLTIDELIKKPKKTNLIIVLDHTQDPFNLGAILRTCAAAGVDGVIIPKLNQAPLNHNATLKASQGYSLTVDVAIVSNLTNAISKLKKEGWWIYATNLDETSKSYKTVDYSEKKVLIIGSEGDGVSPILKKIADHQIYIPMAKNIDSLNISVAVGILVFYLI